MSKEDKIDYINMVIALLVLIGFILSISGGLK